jgi:hypothetical protein
VFFSRCAPTSLLDSCEQLAYKTTIAISFPALVASGLFAYSRIGVPYGSGELIPTSYQLALYCHLFVGLLYLGVAETQKSKRCRISIAMMLVLLPRFLISIQGGRFFLAQAVVPIVLISLARGWFILSGKRVFYLCLVAAFIFFVPSLTRGDNIAGQDELIQFIANGSTLQLFQDNVDMNVSDRCSPLLVSMTAKSVPYGAMKECTIDIWGQKNLPATLDRILAYNDPITEGTLNGPGSNYLLELYLCGGILAVILGSVLFGYSSRCFTAWISRRSLFAGIWAECLTRALLAPRGNLGYVYEKIPGLMIATLVIAAVSYCGTHSKQASIA